MKEEVTTIGDNFGILLKFPVVSFISRTSDWRNKDWARFNDKMMTGSDIEMTGEENKTLAVELMMSKYNVPIKWLNAGMRFIAGFP